jgi:hypothetical protein
MANRAYLCCCKETNLLIGEKCFNVTQDHKVKLEDDIPILERPYAVPFLWFILFGPENLVSIKETFVKNKGLFKKRKVEFHSSITILITTRDEAIKNLEDKKEFFIQLFREFGDLSEYIDLFKQMLLKLEMPYIFLNLEEIECLGGSCYSKVETILNGLERKENILPNGRLLDALLDMAGIEEKERHSRKLPSARYEVDHIEVSENEEKMFFEVWGASWGEIKVPWELDLDTSDDMRFSM